MKRAPLLALPLLALGLAGCTTDNRASLSIQAICAMPTSCTFADTCDAAFAGFPTLDVNVASATNPRIWLVLQVQNQLPNNANTDTFRTNTNDAHVDEIAVDYEGIALPPQVMGAQSVVPAAGSTVVSAEVIPAALGAGAALAAYATATGREMIANVRMRGYYDDGSRFETGKFSIPIRICAGCVTATTGLCPTAATCPPGSNGQLPIACL